VVNTYTIIVASKTILAIVCGELYGVAARLRMLMMMKGGGVSEVTAMLPRQRVRELNGHVSARLYDEAQDRLANTTPNVNRTTLLEGYKH